MPRPDSEFALGLRALKTVLASHHSLGVSQIAAALRLAKSSTHDLLARLCATGFLEQHRGTRRYHVGPGIFAFLHEVSEHFGANSRMLGHLRALAREREHTLYVSMLGARHSYVVLATGPLGDSVTLGASSPVDRSSAGKVLVAQLPEAQWAEFAPPDGPGTQRAARERFLAEVALAAREGVAWNLRGSESNICSVAAPIPEPGVVANKAVAIVMTNTEFPRHDRRALAAQVRWYANELAASLVPRPLDAPVTRTRRRRK